MFLSLLLHVHVEITACTLRLKMKENGELTESFILSIKKVQVFENTYTRLKLQHHARFQCTTKIYDHLSVLIKIQT